MKDSFFDLLYTADIKNKTTLSLTYLRHIIKKDKFDPFLKDYPIIDQEFSDAIERFRNFERNTSSYIIDGNLGVIDKLRIYLDDNDELHKMFLAWFKWNKNRVIENNKKKQMEFNRLRAGIPHALSLMKELNHIKDDANIILSEHDDSNKNVRLESIINHVNNALSIVDEMS